uniref:Uncharacterized protein n=1 Tax=Arundo donax TaxID=35708 RepID=A0A0A8ZD83_ARUDO
MEEYYLVFLNLNFCCA